MKKSLFLLIIPCLFLVNACQTSQEDSFSIDYESYMLDNGLEVILHQDLSDPITAVAIQYHVGSNREVTGKTGFAHLFEHMMFQESENVGQDEFFKKIQGAGGTLNGGTSKDGTIYFEVVPKNALEMALWLESDRMGYMINTVTKSAFANQQNVVQNEKRQNYDNRPYGHMGYVIDNNLYPEGHPYSWQTIGVMEDLFNATVEDVKEFHSRYYLPNNATLVIAGDFDTDEVKSLVEKYFEEIPGGETVVDLDPIPVTLEETKKLYHEDNFARAPQLRMVWPTVEQYNPDAYALDMLAELLAGGKKSPMYKILVKENKLTSRVSVRNSAMELTGGMNIYVTANSGVSLADVENALFEAFAKFEEEGFTEEDLVRIKAGLETGFYNSISSVLGKSFQLARYNEYADDPSFIEQDIKNIEAVSSEDVMRVYEKYIKDKPYVAASFVPKGQVDLVAENSVDAGIVEENIADATEVVVEEMEEEEIARTPSNFDRSIEPEKGADPALTLPEVWTASLDNGIGIWGIEHDELPLVQYSLVIGGGHLAEIPEKAGVANILAMMMTEGTANRTPEELEEAIELLGAYISVRSGMEEITINVNALSKNFEATLDLVEEILFEPRWDEEQFGIVKSRVVNSIKRNAANPNYIASSTFRKLLFGEESILAIDQDGTVESVEGITMEDLKEFYSNYLSPTVARFHIVGSIDKARTVAALIDINEKWEAIEVAVPEFEFKSMPEESTIYFVNIPGAKQSVINVGALALARSDPDFYPATVMNYKLGGSFNGFLNLILREEKGFTYGARSYFNGYKSHGYFTASSSVRSNATLESVQIFKEEMEKYMEGISDEDLVFTKDALIKGNARRFETLGSLLGMISTISKYDLPADYIKQEEDFIKKYDNSVHIDLASKYLKPGNMYFVVAGDAETQMKELEKVGLGTPVLYNQ